MKDWKDDHNQDQGRKGENKIGTGICRRNIREKQINMGSDYINLKH